MGTDSISAIPHDFEAERAILGWILMDNDCYNDVAGIISPNSFHEEDHRHIYKAMVELFEEENPVDKITLGNLLSQYGKIEDIGGYAYLAELENEAPVQGNIKFWAITVKEHAIMRDLITICSDIGRKGRDPKQRVTDLITEAESKIREIDCLTGQDEAVHIKTVLLENLDDLEQRSADKEEIIGVSTGFYDLDRLLSGLIPGTQTLIAARPGMGKTALALNIAEYAALKDAKPGAVYVVSREMQNTQLGRRLLSSKSGVDSWKLKTGSNLEQEDWDCLARATDELCGCEMYLNEKTKQIDRLTHSVKRLHRDLKDGVKLVIVDYLQLVHGSDERTREQEVAKISWKLKDLAKELNTAVVSLSQLNRGLENRDNKRPKLSDLRESGSLEQDADIILFIYRDEIYNEETEKRGIAEIIIAKHREGPTGMIELVFTGKYTRFSNISRLNHELR